MSNFASSRETMVAINSSNCLKLDRVPESKADCLSSRKVRVWLQRLLLDSLRSWSNASEIEEIMRLDAFLDLSDSIRPIAVWIVRMYGETWKITSRWFEWNYFATIEKILIPSVSISGQARSEIEEFPGISLLASTSFLKVSKSKWSLRSACLMRKCVTLRLCLDESTMLLGFLDWRE